MFNPLIILYYKCLRNNFLIINNALKCPFTVERNIILNFVFFKMANDVLGFHTNLLTDCQFMKPKTSSETSMKLFQKSHALSSSSHNISPGLCHQRPNFAESYILILLFSLVTLEQNIYICKTIKFEGHQSLQAPYYLLRNNTVLRTSLFPGKHRAI